MRLRSSSPMMQALVVAFILLISCCYCCRGIVLSSLHFQSPAARDNETMRDGHALLSLLSSILGDPSHALSSWNESLHYCRWRGVTCGGRRHPQRVTALDLASLGLAGSLSPSLANLTFLRTLHLSDNRLHGTIPPEVGALFRLRYLNLSLNSLQGEVPASLGGCSRLQHLSLRNNMLRGEIPTNLSRCSDLQIMSLRNNMLSGPIPAEICSLPRLGYLSLGNNRLAGLIPPSLGNLSSLTTLDLSENDLAGPIPPELGRLLQLQYLILGNNSLQGSIPSNLSRCSNLLQVDLGGSNLTGALPAEFVSLPGLRVLTLCENHLSGVIPPSLGNLSSAFAISLSENFLEGGIPRELGNIAGLEFLNLAFNRLTGEVPPSLYNLSLQHVLELGDNRLTGTLAPHIGHSFPKLQILFMYNNQLEGSIPSSLPNASRLQEVDFSMNRFSGHVPSNLGNLQYLVKLNLGDNMLEARGADDWGFLASLTNCSHLKILILRKNRLAGTLPQSIAHLSSTLEVFDMGRNPILGSIPQEIGKLNNMLVFGMYENLLTGTIPSSIGRLSKLKRLGLFGNMFSGEIPSSIGNLTELTELDLSKNNLQGEVPSSFRNCQQLVALDLSNNALNGHIPVEVFSIPTLSIMLNLSRNSFVGSLPAEVGNLKNLITLDVSGNKLSGEIPKSLSQCQVLGFLYMDGNFFHGTILEPLQDLRGMVELGLSHNNLSGPIPRVLESFPFLQYLNLSFNNFEGEVPSKGIFGNMSVSSIIENDQLCGGNPRLHLQPCPTQASKKRPRRHDLKVILILCVSFFMVFVCCFIVYCCWIRKPRNKQMPPSASMKNQLFRVSYAELLKATDGFSSANLIGVGSFGSVYKGILGSDQRRVAVKVLNLQREGASKSFMYECEVLRNIRHHNLIKILTACSSVDFQGNDFKALVYEFMPNGSLEQWLHSQASERSLSRSLSLIQRLSAAIDVACALEYLHGHHSQRAIIHCDLKPSNILLDDDMIAHVGDFGISRFLSGHALEASQELHSSTIGVKGSIGYIAPEYAMGNPISTQGDAYSYGILLLEMFTGKKPTDDSLKGTVSLHKYVEHHFPQEVVNIIDSHLLSLEEDEGTSHRTQNVRYARGRLVDCLVSVMGVGLSCSEEVPRERMEIKDAWKKLQLIRDTYLGAGSYRALQKWRVTEPLECE